MKNNYIKVAACYAIAALSFAFTGCVTLPNYNEEAVEKFQNASGTPEDSVVFYGFLPMNDAVQFTQINKAFGDDVQTGLNLKRMDHSGFWVSTPVKPGSTYMMSYIKGSVQGGMSMETKTVPTGNLKQTTTTTTFETYVWDQKFEKDQQYFVVNVPSKPGFYCFGMYMGRNIMIEAQKGKPTVIYDQDHITEMWGEKAAQVMINGLNQIQKVYHDTVWDEAAAVEMEKYRK